MTRERLRKQVEAKAERAAEERVLDALVGEQASADTRQKFRKMLREGTLDDREIEVTVQESAAANLPTFEIPGMPGAQMGMLNLGDIFGKAFGGRPTTKKMNVADSHRVLMAEESDKLLDQERVVREAIQSVEQNGIVFLDEIDKICGRSERGGGYSGADVSREGVQRDLLPLIEGTTVATKHGTVKTDHILFIASGAFHLAKPSDLLPELQGRLPIRVELKALDRADLRRILTEPEASLIKQYRALLGHRRRRPRIPATMRSTRSRCWPSRSTRRSRISARAGCTRSSNGCSRRSASPPPTSRTARSWRSTPPMSASGSARWRRTPICRASSCSVPAARSVYSGTGHALNRDAAALTSIRQ